MVIVGPKQSHRLARKLLEIAFMNLLKAKAEGSLDFGEPEFKGQIEIDSEIDFVLKEQNFQQINKVQTAFNCIVKLHNLGKKTEVSVSAENIQDLQDALSQLNIASKRIPIPEDEIEFLKLTAEDLRRQSEMLALKVEEDERKGNFLWAIGQVENLQDIEEIYKFHTSMNQPSQKLSSRQPLHHDSPPPKRQVIRKEPEQPKTEPV